MKFNNYSRYLVPEKTIFRVHLLSWLAVMRVCSIQSHDHPFFGMR